jgi:transposase-like protein
MQPKVKAELHEIWMAATREDAERAFDLTIKRFEAKYPQAMDCLSKDRDALLAFYDYPAEHWVHRSGSACLNSTTHWDKWNLAARFKLPWARTAN